MDIGIGVGRPKKELNAQDITFIPYGYDPFTILLNRNWHCQFINWNVFFERLNCCLKASEP